MKLFGLNSHTDASIILASMNSHWMSASSTYMPDCYPQAQAGIELNASRCLQVGSLALAVSKELLECTDPAIIRRERNRAFLLQASTDDVNGVLTLVAPKPEDDKAALVRLELCGYPHLCIRYQPTEQQLVCRAGAAEGFPDERLLARIEPGKPLKARRFDQKYAFFGPERVRELLDIRFDGRTIACDNQPIAAPGVWRTLFG